MSAAHFALIKNFERRSTQRSFWKSPSAQLSAQEKWAALRAPLIWAPLTHTLFSRHRPSLDDEDFRSGLIFFISFVLSVISSSYGLSNFLVNGPPKLVQKWVASMLLFTSNLTCLVGKAVWLALMTYGPAKENNLLLFAWFGFSIAPNIILVRLKKRKVWMLLKIQQSISTGC